jgi:hypothetical protein
VPKQTVGPLAGFWSEDHSLSAFLVLIVLVYFVLGPLAHLGPVVVFVMQTFFALLFISGINAVFPVSRVRTPAKILTLTAWLTHQVVILRPSRLLVQSDMLLTFLCLVLFVVILLARVLGDGESNHFRVQGAIAAYMMSAIAWGHLYALLEALSPGCFAAPKGYLEGSQLVGSMTFFSSITLTTVGYGDITPVHKFARSMVCLEAYYGVLYPAILVSRLVSLSISPAPAPAPSETPAS